MEGQEDWPDNHPPEDCSLGIKNTEYGKTEDSDPKKREASVKGESNISMGENIVEENFVPKQN